MSEVERLSKRYCIKSQNLQIWGLVFNFASIVFRFKANDSNNKTLSLVIFAGYEGGHIEEKIHNPRFLKCFRSFFKNKGLKILSSV